MNKIFEDNFLEIVEHEQEYIYSNIKYENDIAKNKLLLENLFVLFCCINAKIPLFILGKTGYSKTFSMKLLIKSMKGGISESPLFKKYPSLNVSSYFCSLKSTSVEIFHSFERARRVLEYNNKNLENIISTVYFEDMGFAEQSPNNPLKIMKYIFDYKNNEGNKKLSFVGLSHLNLDASLLNRGLFLCISTPDLEDLETSAQCFAESYNIKLARDNKDLFEVLAKIYYEYKEILKKQYINKKDFHGLRDFYHLIKML